MNTILIEMQHHAVNRGRASMPVAAGYAPAYLTTGNFDGWTEAASCPTKHRSRRRRSRT